MVEGNETIGDWTGLLPKEPRSTSMHRRHQGLWRHEIGWPCGEPRLERTRARYPTLPNLLAESHGGITAREAGVNLMSDAARTYAETRLPVLEQIGGAAEPDRLYRNLLSSQPLAFSIAGELRARPQAAAAVLANLSGLPVDGLADLADEQQSGGRYRLDGIEAEWFPPREFHTGDRSGCDIAACVRAGGERVLITVEVKYTDSFSPKPLEWQRYEQHLVSLGLDEAATANLVRQGCSQVLRQVLITHSVVCSGLAPDSLAAGRVDRGVVAVLARHDDDRARRVVEAIDDAIDMSVQSWSIRQLLEAATEQPDLAAWSAGMRRRYVPD